MKVVVFIDVQNDFVLTTGALPYKYPEVRNHQKIVEFANECRKRGYVMFATLDTHNPTNDMSHTGYLYSYEGKNLPVEHCIEKSYGHRLIDGLATTVDAIVNIPNGWQCKKASFGSFDIAYNIQSALRDELNEPIDEIVICGYCTSICVVSNALILRANFENTPISVIGELCGDIDEESHLAALKVMRNCMIFNKSVSDVLGPQSA